MIWYENLYIGESIPKKDAKIRRLKWKIEHRAGLPDIYIIILCRNGGGLLEIIPARELLQKHYPVHRMYVVGLARGYKESLRTAADIVTDVYRQTGGFEIRGFVLKQKQKAGDRI